MALTSSSTLDLGTALPAFRLPDTVTGRQVSASDFDGHALVVSFICNHCPYVRHIVAEYARFGRDCEALGVGHVAISSNDVDAYPADAPPKMKALAEQLDFAFPYLFDETQDVARRFGAECTPEFFVFGADGRLAYRGQFDDSRPGNGRPCDGSDLRAAVRAVAAGELPSGDQRPSIGCNIKWRTD